MNHPMSCDFLFPWALTRGPFWRGEWSSRAIDWASLVPYRVLYRLPGPFGWNDKAVNAEKEDMAERNEEQLAKLIKDLRAKRGLTQEQFAAKVGVTFSTVNRWENGRGKPSPLAMRRIEELKEQTDSKE